MWQANADAELELVQAVQFDFENLSMQLINFELGLVEYQNLFFKDDTAFMANIAWS
jgi:hypothetical protein